jgi:hypothetical protein
VLLTLERLRCRLKASQHKLREVHLPPTEAEAEPMAFSTQTNKQTIAEGDSLLMHRKATHSWA